MEGKPGENNCCPKTKKFPEISEQGQGWKRGHRRGHFLGQGFTDGKISVKKYIIDTNALISFVTDRNLNQQQIMKSIFETASSLKGLIICHSHVLTEFVYVMEKI
jgi:hypothetical protein